MRCKVRKFFLSRKSLPTGSFSRAGQGAGIQISGRESGLVKARKRQSPAVFGEGFTGSQADRIFGKERGAQFPERSGRSGSPEKKGLRAGFGKTELAGLWEGRGERCGARGFRAKVRERRGSGRDSEKTELAGLRKVGIERCGARGFRAKVRKRRGSGRDSGKAQLTNIRAVWSEKTGCRERYCPGIRHVDKKAPATDYIFSRSL